MKLRMMALLGVAVTVMAAACFFGAGPVLAQNAYITNSGDNTVSVIDTASNTVIATIPVGRNPFGVAVTPDGAKIYITNRGSFQEFSDTVSVIEAASNTVTTIIPIGRSPSGVAVSPEGSRVYVANSGGPPDFLGTVSVIDTTSDTVIASILVSGNPIGVAVTPDGNRLYVGNFFPGLSVIDTGTLMEIGTIPIGGFTTSGLAITPDGTKIYVAAVRPKQSPTLSVIETANNTLVGVTQLNGSPGGLATTPDGSKVYVADGFSYDVSVIDTISNTVTTGIPVGVGSYPVGVAVTPDGQHLYVANSGTATVSVIDTASNTVIATIPVGAAPMAFGNFIQPVTTIRFAGTPGKSNCHGKSVSALARQYHGMNNAAASLGFPSVEALQNAIDAFCRG
jgi:YVTN family beta-propeller protein